MFQVPQAAWLTLKYQVIASPTLIQIPLLISMEIAELTCSSLLKTLAAILISKSGSEPPIPNSA